MVCVKASNSFMDTSRPVGTTAGRDAGAARAGPRPGSAAADAGAVARASIRSAARAPRHVVLSGVPARPVADGAGSAVEADGSVGVNVACGPTNCARRLRNRPDTMPDVVAACAVDDGAEVDVAEYRRWALGSRVEEAPAEKDVAPLPRCGSRSSTRHSACAMERDDDAQWAGQPPAAAAAAR